jgi:manganese/iron transport system permease protein
VSSAGRLLFEPFAAPYLQRALGMIALLAVLGGVVGVHVVLRRLAFVTDALQHTIFPGIAVAYALGGSLLLGGLVAALVSVVLLTVLARHPRVDTDAALALLVSGFFALGVVVVSRGHSFQSDLTALLFGRILDVDRAELVDTALVAAVTVTVLVVLHKELLLRAFDPEASDALGYPGALLDGVVHVAVALTVVAAVRALGSVLLLAFVVTPAAAARLVCRSPAGMMAVAAGLVALCGWLALALSYQASLAWGWRLAPGAAVVAALSLAFIVLAAPRALLGHTGRLPA